MKTLRVNASTPYDVHIDRGLLARLGEHAAHCRADKIAVVTDAHVAPLHLAAALEALESAGQVTCSLVLPPGEGSKSLATLGQVLDFLCKEQLTKAGLLIALGGGVMGDLTGFAASVYLRGVRYIQCPTTLLAAVDSSVGGKTAVNLSAGKNLAGSFWQPQAVLCDTATLYTLPDAVLSDGVAEALKCGVLRDPALFSLLANGLRRCDLPEVIARCVALKAAIVAADEFDNGERQLLNLGHTVGHAIERCSGYTLSHGQAVAMGLVCVARAAARLDLCESDIAPEIAAAARANGLPTDIPYGAVALAQAALGDKKRRGDSLTLILPRRMGACFRHSLPIAQLEAFLAAGLQPPGGTP